MDNSIYAWLRRANFLLLLLVTVCGALLKVNPSDVVPADRVVEWVQARAYWIIPAGTIIAFLSKYLSDWMGPPWAWEAIANAVNIYRKHAFVNLDGEAAHKHRVTLFKRKWCWRPSPARHHYWPWGAWRFPCSGWMVPIVRSGWATQNLKTSFLAPDDADNSEGITGEVWQINDVVLRELPAVTRESSEEDIQAYAIIAKVSPDWVRKRLDAGKSCPRALCVFPVERNNKVWGVLVLDSSRTDTIDYEGPTFKVFTDMAKTSLSGYLSKV